MPRSWPFSGNCRGVIAVFPTTRASYSPQRGGRVTPILPLSTRIMDFFAFEIDWASVQVYSCSWSSRLDRPDLGARRSKLPHYLPFPSSLPRPASSRLALVVFDLAQGRVGVGSSWCRRVLSCVTKSSGVENAACYIRKTMTCLHSGSRTWLVVGGRIGCPSADILIALLALSEANRRLSSSTVGVLRSSPWKILRLRLFPLSVRGNERDPAWFSLIRTKPDNTPIPGAPSTSERLVWLVVPHRSG